MTKNSKDNGTTSSSRPTRKWPVSEPPPMKFLDESHPIFSNPTVITFGENSMISTRSLEKDSTQPEEEPAKVSKIVKLLRKL